MTPRQIEAAILETAEVLERGAKTHLRLAELVARLAAKLLELDGRVQTLEKEKAK